MKLTRRTNSIILWVISIGLLVSMVIAFTPSFGNLFGGAGVGTNVSPTVFEVNGEDVTELDVARAEQNPPFNLNVEGEAGDDLRLLLVDSLVDNTVLRQAASKTRVSGGEVNAAVNDFRESQNVAGSRNDRAYLTLINRFGFDDASFRAYFRDQLRAEKYQEALTEDVTVSDEEVAAFYEANPQAYQTEARVRAREIVLDDEAVAADVYARAAAGEDFAALATETSLERADRAGALGAAEGTTEPEPVGRAALPTPVADAAFGLQGPGLTQVIPAGDRYYVVKVEDFVAAGTKPFEEVRDQVADDALAAKKAGVLEAEFEELRAAANLTFPADSAYDLEDTVVARVGDEDIKRSELSRAVYLSPQIQQSLSPQTAELVTTLFKPSVLEQLINRDLAYQGADTLDAQFIGSKGQVAQEALAFVSRDAAASDEELQTYYDANQDSFTVPASAVVTRTDFASETAASDFRNALLAGGDLQDAANAAGGTVQDLGTVRQGALQPELDSVLFETDAFTPLPNSVEAVSDVLVLNEPAEPDPVGAETGGSDTGGAETGGTETGGTETSSADASVTTDETIDAETADAEAATEAETGGATETTTQDVYVVLVAERTPARVRPLSEVRAQVESAVLQTKRAELQETWLTGLREEIGVENLLAAANPGDGFTTAPLDTGSETGGAPLEEAPADTGAEPADLEAIDAEGVDPVIDTVPAAEDATPADETTDTPSTDPATAPTEETTP